MGDIYHVHGHLYFVVGDICRVHIYFNHVLVDIYHVYEDLHHALGALSVTDWITFEAISEVLTDWIRLDFVANQ
jgi:hypothetical protein